MSKSQVNAIDLVESDFRKIRKLLSDKYKKTYTVDYIRKVCKGKRNNSIILEIADQYVALLNELEDKIENLSKND